jgi:CCR4-NOT transcription complex subunit 3
VGVAGKAKNKEDIVAMEGFITRHKKHIAKLEQIIRLMDNDLLDPAQIDDVSGPLLWEARKWARI